MGNWQSVQQLLARNFGTMEIADQEIDALIPREKGQKPPPANSRAFKCAFPTPLLVDKPEAVYRSHVREIAARARDGASKDKMNEPTWSEILSALSATSLKSPLTSEHTNIMEWAFLQVFGEEATIAKLENLPTEPRQAYELDVLAETRRAVGKMTRREP